MHGNYGQSELKVLSDHYSPHNVVHPNAAISKLKVLNSVVAANSELKQLPPRELTTRMLNTIELIPCFPTSARKLPLDFFFQCPQSTANEDSQLSHE